MMALTIDLPDDAARAAAEKARRTNRTLAEWIRVHIAGRWSAVSVAERDALGYPHGWLSAAPVRWPRWRISARRMIHPPRGWRGLLVGVRGVSCVGMSITIKLPPDLESRVSAIPNLDQRLLDFLRDQADLEDWRRRRYSAEARSIVAEATSEDAQGMTREQAFRDLREMRLDIGRRL